MAKKILVVEDEEIMFNLLKRRLEREGYEVYIAEDGEKGLTVMKEVDPDLILLDIIMPKLGGLEVMEKMKEDKSLSSIPVIVISNSGQPVEIDKAQRLGARDWLVKANFDLQEIVDKVNNQIGK